MFIFQSDAEHSFSLKYLSLHVKKVGLILYMVEHLAYFVLYVDAFLYMAVMSDSSNPVLPPLWFYILQHFISDWATGGLRPCAMGKLSYPWSETD